MSKPPFEFDTLALHAGQRPDAETGARATPIYQSASFVFESAEAAAGLFNLERTGHVYSRLSNPTNAVLEERIAVLDQGVGAVAVASGQAAMHLAVATLMGAGDHIVASRSLYGGTHNLLSYTLPRFGIETTFVDPRDPAAFSAAIQDNTKLVFGEVVGNPGMEVLDIPAISEVAHAAGIPVMIDATFTTPYLCRPIELGADLVMHSATKFLSGHGIVIGGLLVDGGVFDWAASGRFPTLAEPFDGFHHLNFAEEFGPAAFIARARREGLRDFGACMAPTTAFHILQGIETLSLRMARHMENAEVIAKFLSGQEGVLSVLHPCLPSHPDYELAKKLLPNGAGAVMSFEIAGGREAGVRFIEGLKIFSHLANVGDAKSLVIHPASTTHHRMDAEALVAAGISEGMIRLSIGLEDAADLIKDLKAGLRSAAKGGR
ncbi:MAG: O-acetylhomoserine aminocarboxypropyltransferase [Gammaproteobacteria bacterium]|jgi:O-acetylhomoserine (thiol)-lyase|nr:O-acetylhomoserine aminocarboxypropyltransferase [Gammaproteobacteria bacterium]MBT5053386.1 O-acetylhomoserine aminocarboxypropyltransferase [Gammaproteobacteria bacterium]